MVVFTEPGLLGGDADFPDPVVWKGEFLIGLFPEVLVLSPGRFGQYGGNELKAFKGFFLLGRLLSWVPPERFLGVRPRS